MNNKYKILPVILAGGSGSRLWPLSRDNFPKQYIALSHNNELSQIQCTLKRINNLKNIFEPLIICNEEHRFLVAEQCREINIKPSSIILEPFGRNTAPAITLAAIKATKNNKDSILLVLSADHEIKNINNFLNTIKKGIKYANENKLVTFGIVPKSPETGFGYIQSTKPIIGKNEASKIDKFIEKPNLETAKRFILDERFTWNSGIFMFKASRILEELKKHTPQLLDICIESIENSSIDLDFLRINKKSFKNCPNISIDNAVMEKTNQGMVLPMDAEWSDLGSWNAILETSNKDLNGNAVKGEVILKNSNGCYLRSEKSLIVALGIKDLILVDTSDAILIAHKKHLDGLKSVVKELKENQKDQAKFHKKVHRPWGNYTTIEEGSGWKVKIIEVKPNSSLSLQMHNHRVEHWIVVKGKAQVEIADNKFLLKENQSTFIPLGAKHRLSNPTEEILSLIEVQSGNYLGEDDIIRFKDYYGRV